MLQVVASPSPSISVTVQIQESPWTVVLAVATIVLAAATLAAFVVFFLQLRTSREELEDAVTPMIWGVFADQSGARGAPTAEMELLIYVGGSGVAFHVTHGVRAVNPRDWAALNFEMGAGPHGPFRASDDPVRSVSMRWRKPSSPVLVEVHIAFRNVNNRRYIWRQVIRLVDDPADPTHVYDRVEEDRPFRQRVNA